MSRSVFFYICGINPNAYNDMRSPLFAIFTFVTLLFAGCDSDNSQYPTGSDGPINSDIVLELPSSMELTPAELKLVNCSNGFTFDLFSKLCETKGNSSVVSSPLSVTYALGMLNNGAKGNTQKQINDALGFGDSGADSINAFCYKLINTAPVLDSLTKILLANTIFVNKNETLKELFVRKANLYYKADAKSRDFSDANTLNEINQWASDNTEQLIQKVLKEDEYSPLAVSYLLNAIYFKGTWAYKFDKNKTVDESFFLAGGQGSVKSIPMMQMTSIFDYAQNDEYEALCLPYGNGSFRMTILLPVISQGQNGYDVPTVPSLETWNQLNQSMRKTDYTVKLPRFETDSEANLIPIMESLGMTDAFESGTADFSDFCETADGVYINLLKQVAKIKVDEEGSEAAAVTVIGIWKSYTTFNANRPFIYVISDTVTGSIFFIGRYTGI